MSPKTSLAHNGAASSAFATDDDLYLFNEGTNHRLYRRFGAHPATVHGRTGCAFTVWAPNASSVHVIGDFNGWDRGADPLRSRGASGVWETFVEGARPGARYKYAITNRQSHHRVDKADPVGFATEVPPRTGSVVADLSFDWQDAAWMRERGERQSLKAPLTIYEVHLGSWRRVPEEGNRSLTYREAAPRLAEHVTKLGFTHVELMPIMEHPFYGSWGYQTSGYFAPTARYGEPRDLKFLIDTLHRAGIGVILDWVPSHFPADEHGLAFFDGTHLYEHADPRLGFHPDWTSSIFNYGRHEVRSFLLSSALFWLEEYHADALRVDAVASMLYLDYSRKPGEWVPNVHGGRENLEAIEFLRHLNRVVYQEHPDVQTFAEESTAWPMVSRPTYVGGLGFGYKWDMGWMHDNLVFFAKDPVHRKFHQHLLTFRALYAFAENFVLPLSHDEVVHGKGSLLRKMPGDDWQRLANLRLLYGLMFAQPGKKLLFMGAELASENEWYHEASLDWHLEGRAENRGIREWLTHMLHLYRDTPSLHERDVDPQGFEWIDCNDVLANVVSFVRRGTGPDDLALVVANATPIVRDDYRVGAPRAGTWNEVANSDDVRYGGSGVRNPGPRATEPAPLHGRAQSLRLRLPPLGITILTYGGPA